MRDRPPVLRSSVLRTLPAALALALLALGTRALPAAAGEQRPPKGAEKIERYPPSFRQAVKEAIDEGVMHLRGLQATTGHWGDPNHDQAMGHTALPTLTLLKAGVPKDDPQVKLALKALHAMPMTRTYSVALFLMVIQATYQPKLDTLDTEVGTDRHERVKPKEAYKRLSEQDRAALESGVHFLRQAQNASGLWHYGILEAEGGTSHDLSNTQYALLGLRAAMDCGVKVKAHVWRDALRALLAHQDDKGPEVDLLEERVRGRYVLRSKIPAEARGFHYNNGRKDGPLGEKTIWTHPPTGSMTTAGVAGVSICSEGLWRSRRFSGAERKRAADATRDGIAWMQESFTVTENPGHPRKAHLMYYLYGLERMGMLVGRRWIGKHDWYKEGADYLLARRDDFRGGWGGHVPTCYGVLFLKRATRRADQVVTTGD